MKEKIRAALGKGKAYFLKFLEKELIQLVLKKILNNVLMGGFKVLLIKFVVTKFVKEVIELIEVTTDYIDLNVKLAATVDIEDRNAATDSLNDIIK